MIPKFIVNNKKKLNNSTKTVPKQVKQTPGAYLENSQTSTIVLFARSG